MGHVRIRVLIARELLPDQQPVNNNDNDEQWHAIVHSESADATVRDVYEQVLEPLALPNDACVWDCTLYPPKEITDWLVLYNCKTGPRSKTLYDAKWFPSGMWQVLPKGKQPVHTQNYDDVQYNLPSALISTCAVQLVEQETRTRPSQVLQSVVERFPQEEDPDNALEIRRARRNEKEKKEKDRHDQLERQIHLLQSSSKPVSQQVKRMLIKSRCTGRCSLKMQDRIHLHVVIIRGNEETKQEYRYFSQQDTVARILQLVPIQLPLEAELLVGLPNNVFRRLPPTMRLYEAIASNYIHEVDSIVIRCFTPPEEEPTTSILETTCNVEMQDDNVVPSVATVQDESASSIQGLEAEMTVMDDAVDVDVCNQMSQAVAAMDDEATSSKSKKKASTSTSAKVRTMLIKSKAKGDAKRIPKMEHRFFLELVVIQTVHGKCVASASPIFLSKTDPVGRLLRDCVSVPSGLDAMILVPTEQGGFRKVPTDIILQDAETQGLFKSFDRIVVLLQKKS
jgi:hypothetical protein